MLFLSTFKIYFPTKSEPFYGFDLNETACMIYALINSGFRVFVFDA